MKFFCFLFLFFFSNRFYAIYYPLSKKCSTGLCWITIALIWGMSFAISLPWLIFFEVSPIADNLGEILYVSSSRIFFVFISFPSNSLFHPNPISFFRSIFIQLCFFSLFISLFCLHNL